MSRYTVVIKNRFADEQTVARIKTFDEKSHYYPKDSAETLKDELNKEIDNDIYFADVEVEEG